MHCVHIAIDVSTVTKVMRPLIKSFITCLVVHVAESYVDAEAMANRATFRSDIGTEPSDDEETVQARKRRLIHRFSLGITRPECS